MNDTSRKDNNYLSISNCSICCKLFQKQEISEELNQLFPSEVKKLKEVNFSLKKCPICGNFYYYDEYDFCPDPLEISVRTYKRLIRCSYFQVKDLLLDPNVEEENKEMLIKEWEEFKSKYHKMVEDFTKTIRQNSSTLEWQIMKYLIEFLTDIYLENNDWESFFKILLQNENPVVRVETAYDFLLITTESITGQRYFTTSIQKLARNLLFVRRSERCKILVQVFTESLFDDTISYEISVIGYKEIPLSQKAYAGLSSASYRGFDMSLAIPSIVKWLSGSKKWYKENAYSFLIDLFTRNEDYSGIIREEIIKSKRRNKEMASILRKCKIFKKE